MITLEQLQQKRAEFEARLNDALSLANALKGAIEALDWVMDQMKEAKNGDKNAPQGPNDDA